MIRQTQYNEAEWKQRLEKMKAAFRRARERAREIARQTGTPLVYRKDGQLVNEYITDESSSDQKQNPS